MKKANIKRTFDLSLKMDLVKKVERGEITVLGISKVYGVSCTAVYKWLRKYSTIYKKQTRVIVEDKSLSKKNAALRAQVAELERYLGQKQMRIDYLEKVVDVASKDLGLDIEKKSKRLL
jgi:transposase